MFPRKQSVAVSIGNATICLNKGHRAAVALLLVRHNQLTIGLASLGVRPTERKKKARDCRAQGPELPQQTKTQGGPAFEQLIKAFKVAGMLKHVPCHLPHDRGRRRIPPQNNRVKKSVLNCATECFAQNVIVSQQ